MWERSHADPLTCPAHEGRGPHCNGRSASYDATDEGHAMNAQELKQRIDRIEDLVDDAKDALQVAGAPDDLKQAVETLHQQARDAKHSNNLDEAMLRQAAMRIEQSADRAKDVCGQAGQVDPQVRQAVMRVHEEASRLKHEIEADSPA